MVHGNERQRSNDRMDLSCGRSTDLVEMSHLYWTNVCGQCAILRTNPYGHLIFVFHPHGLCGNVPFPNSRHGETGLGRGYACWL